MTSRMGAPVGYLFQNDTIVTFQVRKYGSFDRYRTDLVAWNITKNKQLWRVDSLDRKGNGSFNTPIYENEKIYYAGINDIYCLDAFTGKLIWRQGFDNFNYQIIHHSLLSLDYGLIVKSHDNEMALLNKEDGKIIWENRKVGSDPGQLSYYKGDIISINWGTGTLECVNCQTGHTKWKTGSRNRCIINGAHYGRNRFVINPKTNLLYICDYSFIQCLKLPGYD